MKKAFLLLLVVLCNFLFATTINLPEKHFRIDQQRKLILCNMPLDAIRYTGDYIKIRINNVEYKLLDTVKELKVGRKYIITSANEYYIRYALYFTELPLMTINTNETITNEPKVLSHINIIENSGKVVSSNAGIEYRGSTSQAYPKKSFELELWEDNTGASTQELSLLGMREDKDWNLQALYNEVLKARSITSWQLWEKINKLHYLENEPKAKNSIATKYVEVFLNDSYLGVFALSEKIDRKQLKLKKIPIKKFAENYTKLTLGKLLIM